MIFNYFHHHENYSFIILTSSLNGVDRLWGRNWLELDIIFWYDIIVLTGFRISWSNWAGTLWMESRNGWKENKLNGKFISEALPDVLLTRIKLTSFTADVNWVTDKVPRLSNPTCRPSAQQMQRSSPAPSPKMCVYVCVTFEGHHCNQHTYSACMEIRKAKVDEVLRQINRVVFIAECWTFLSEHSYLRVTAHYFHLQ